MEFIDTHQHLIYRESVIYEWTSNKPELKERNFTLEDYQSLTTGREISQTLFMEVDASDGDYKAEARFFAGLVGKDGLNGVIASCRPESEEGFDDWLQEAVALKVNGFRRILHVVPDDVSQSETFRRNVRKIGKAGKTFDICMFARQHAITLELLKACPDQPFILDHCGNPDVAAGAFEPWAASMRKLAEFPNLAVKMSGIAVNCAPGTATLATIRPYVEYMIELFGTDRVVWGSDWPVVNLACGLPDWIDISKAILARYTTDEQAAITHDNARRIYKMDAHA